MPVLNVMPHRKKKTPLFDPRNGDPAIRLRRLQIGDSPFAPDRTNYFTVLHVDAGSGAFWADASRFAFLPNSLLFFVPYQHLRLVPDAPVTGEMIQFHANFLCVETFHSEVGCSGILFNDPQGVPIVPLDRATQAETTRLVDRLLQEQASQQLAHSEVMLAYLKVLLIVASRLKQSQPVLRTNAPFDPQHPTLIEFRELIEQNYCSLHSPAEYAKLLHITAKSLGRIVREHLGATPTELIRARILTHAKWQLLHTLRPVKEIAREIGFEDELYFSRLFKKATGYSPTFFRQFETEIRNGSNLSMSSGHASIQSSSTRLHT
ncbi:MAG: helix-turn-helix domain-containing protein [Blastopirellula sp. JB062]